MSYIFLAKVKAYNDLDPINTTNTTSWHALTADSFADATRILEEFYGNEIESMSLDIISDLGLLTIDESMCARLRELNTF